MQHPLLERWGRLARLISRCFLREHYAGTPTYRRVFQFPVRNCSQIGSRWNSACARAGLTCRPLTALYDSAACLVQWNEKRLIRQWRRWRRRRFEMKSETWSLRCVTAASFGSPLSKRRRCWRNLCLQLVIRVWRLRFPVVAHCHPPSRVAQEMSDKLEGSVKRRCCNVPCVMPCSEKQQALEILRPYMEPMVRKCDVCE